MAAARLPVWGQAISPVAVPLERLHGGSQGACKYCVPLGTTHQA